MSAEKPQTALWIVESLDRVDRLSDLSEDLRIRILSLLPTLDVVRMSILSKQWRQAWHSLPVLNFDEKHSLTKFCTFVKYCMCHRRINCPSFQNTVVTRFRLAVNPSWKIIHQWLKVVSESHVEDLDLEFYASDGSAITYNSVSEKSLPVRSLTSLRLKNADVTGLRYIVLPNLKSLSLASLEFNHQVLNGLLSGCSQLERLRLADCKGLSNPRFLSLSLKFLEIDSTPAQTLHVAAPSLESFKFIGSRTGTTSLNLVKHRNLKSLSLSRAALTARRLVDLCSKLPSLETLTLKNCKSDRFKIRSQHLKRLTFSADEASCGDLEVKINALDLVYFNFKGSPAVNLSLLAPNISESDVEFHETEYDSKWFSNLICFLPQLDSSTNVNLHVQSEEALIFPKEVRICTTTPLCNVEDFKVTVYKQLKRREDLMESMTWMTSN